MATSSIFANFVISDEKSAIALADALEDFEKNGVPYQQVNEKPVLDAKDIKAFFSKGGAST